MCSFATPVAVRELMRQFDTVLTPLSNGAGASSGSLEFGTFDPAARKRCAFFQPIQAGILKVTY